MQGVSGEGLVGVLTGADAGFDVGDSVYEGGSILMMSNQKYGNDAESDGCGDA